MRFRDSGKSCSHRRRESTQELFCPAATPAWIMLGFAPSTKEWCAMRGTMMNFPLTLTHILERAGRLFGKGEIVSRRPDRSLVRSTYADMYRRARRRAAALARAGARTGAPA